VAALASFLNAVFDAAGDVEPDRPTELRIGDSLVMISSTAERQRFPAFLYVYVDDADEAFQRAIAAGATLLEEPLDTPYGDRRAMVSDGFGNIYSDRPAPLLHLKADADSRRVAGHISSGVATVGDRPCPHERQNGRTERRLPEAVRRARTARRAGANTGWERGQMGRPKPH
jgi:PhnB protein